MQGWNVLDEGNKLTFGCRKMKNAYLEYDKRLPYSGSIWWEVGEENTAPEPGYDVSETVPGALVSHKDVQGLLGLARCS